MPLPDIPQWGWDFSVFRAGSKALLTGVNPYTPDALLPYVDGANLATIPYYVYAPFFTLLVLPLTFFQPAIAIRLWMLVNLILYLGSVFLLLDSLNLNFKKTAWLGVMFLSALFAPLRTLIVLGQSGVVMLFFLSMAFWQLKRKRPYQAGAFLSLAFFKPHLVLLLPFFILRRQWKLLLGLLLSSALITLPFLGLIPDWIRLLLSTRTENIVHGCLPFSSLNMFLQCLLPISRASQLAISISMILLLGITAWLVWPHFETHENQYDIQFAAAIIIGLLILDNVRVADLNLLVVPFLILLKHAITTSRRGVHRIVIALLMMAYLFPYLASFMPGDPQFWSLPIWYIGMTTALAIAAGTLLWKFRTPENIPLAKQNRDTAI
jgi:hypothetical protein